VTRRATTVLMGLALLLPLHSAAAADVEKEAPAEEKKRETSFAVVPGPFYNPSIGLGLNVMPLMMFYPDPSDTVSRRKVG